MTERTPIARGSDPWREAAAQRITERLRLRAGLSEGVGILQVWNDCCQQEARDRLLASHGHGGQDAEAARMIAVVDAAADGRADPDAGWD
ncbi:hypothetical protein SAMN05216188_12592 [Lentzea xinjiangensis]|uniref:Uncharacterized protein n=1 Tax=Lentzea xinjiangensis TaxID=402600 RepID=A0A1H9VBU1_9PSEU|nr:hypothetical protein [Lentzea xinjiangensis]SES19001.1 hypothetical protein SAMN05216188_12592 [Lentzea xinjiangensis]